ncbi:hypothetical protein E4U46_004103 [Claviceps purpurea]|nr:hypothetical protein E4U46_004103 [Claviceps purpurea]
MSDAITERALAALDPDDFEGYDEVWREERRRERDRSPPTNEPLDDELKTGQHEQTASTGNSLNSGALKLIFMSLMGLFSEQAGNYPLPNLLVTQSNLNIV